MSPTREVLIDTAAGALRGTSDTLGIACFRAVPYAQAPVGELRFALPRTREPWAGVRDATRPGPIAPQAPSRLRHVMGDFEREQSEDCLTLTVWTPERPAASSRPVIVWLHGGAFMSGAGDLAWYDGARLAHEGDAVVVGVNYRLGALGFLRLPGLCDGNLGLQDQALAIDWVQRHIVAFGGDPARITLMGQSAGGMSIAWLLSRPGPMPASRAILMSAPLGIAPLAPRAAERVGEAFARALGVDPQAGDAPQRLRRARTAELLAAHDQAARSLVESGTAPEGAPPFLPVADGDFLCEQQLATEALASAAARVDVLAGFTHDESTAFGPAPLRTPMTAAVFADPTRRWVVDAAHAGRQAFLYRFDWAPSGSPFGATHCIELPFAFGTREAMRDAPMLGDVEAATFEAMSARVRSHWLSFASTGKAAWPAVRPEEVQALRIDLIDQLISLDP